MRATHSPAQPAVLPEAAAAAALASGEAAAAIEIGGGRAAGATAASPPAAGSAASTSAAGSAAGGLALTLSGEGVQRKLCAIGEGRSEATPLKLRLERAYWLEGRAVVPSHPGWRTVPTQPTQPAPSLTTARLTMAQRPVPPVSKAPTEAERRLFAASNAGDEGGVRAALHDGASAHSSIVKGWTALMNAADGGHVQVRSSQLDYVDS